MYYGDYQQLYSVNNLFDTDINIVSNIYNLNKIRKLCMLFYKQ